MKCIKCGTDNNLRDRTANHGSCSNCSHNFAFEPTAMKGNAKFTDGFFYKVITDISAKNTLFFTVKQFYYFFDTRLKKGANKYNNLGSTIVSLIVSNIWLTVLLGGFLSFFIVKIAFAIALFIFNLGYIFYIYLQAKSDQNNYQNRKSSSQILIVLGVLILVGGIWASIRVFDSFVFFALFTLLGMGSISLGLINRVTLKNSPQSFIASDREISEWLNRWTRINGSLEYQLPSPSAYQFSPVNVETNSYSFDRAVICDKAEIAQLLIFNNFHFENNCAVLSIDGYPQSIFDTVIQMLKRNNELQVYALHDASPKGVSLTHQLRTDEKWFKDSSVTIYDIGILPRHLLKNKNCFILNTEESATEAKLLTEEVQQTLIPDELSWLKSGNFVELESFSPKKLLQIITKGIALSTSPDGNESLILLEDDERLLTTGTLIYGVDSFG